MGALTGIDDLVNRLSGGSSGTPEHIFFGKWPTVNGVAQSQGSSGMPFMSMWMTDGFPGGTGATAPGAASIPDRTTNGGLKQANPGGGRQKWLLGMDVAGPDIGQGHYAYLLYDRLFHMSGLDASITTAQTVQGAGPTPALTRYTSGVGNFVMYENYAQLGITTTRQITASYTDQAGNTGHTTTNVPIGGAAASASSAICGAWIMPLASGDTGVRAVNTVTIAGGSTGAAGNFGVTIGHPLAMIFADMANGQGGSKDGIAVFPSIVEIPTDACLALLLVNNINSTWGGRPMIGMTHALEA